MRECWDDEGRGVVCSSLTLSYAVETTSNCPSSTTLYFLVDDPVGSIPTLPHVHLLRHLHAFFYCCRSRVSEKQSRGVQSRKSSSTLSCLPFPALGVLCSECSRGRICPRIKPLPSVLRLHTAACSFHVVACSTPHDERRDDRGFGERLRVTMRGRVWLCLLHMSEGNSGEMERLMGESTVPHLDLTHHSALPIDTLSTNHASQDDARRGAKG